MALTNYVRQWLGRADEDIQTAEILLREETSANIICFHSQQAGEKFLKGFLAFHEKHIRKIHDMSAILAECE